MLLINKYKPECLDDITINTDKLSLTNDIYFHKKIIELLKNMSRDDSIPNIMFHGSTGSGKKTIINLFLEMLFDKSVHNTKEIKYTVSGSNNKQNIEIINQSNYHIVIEPKNTNYDRYIIRDIVKEYAKQHSLNVFKTKRAFRIILINNVDNLSYYAQVSLRRTMERYHENCRFIMCCNSLSKVITPLRSRCICLRIPCPTDNELLYYLLDISIKENMNNVSFDKLIKIIKNSKGDITKALFELEYLKYGYEFETNYKKYIIDIINNLFEFKLNKMYVIRELVYKIIISSIDEITIIHDLINEIINRNINDKIKQQIIEIISNNEYNMTSGRRSIIHFDNMFISIMNILKCNQNVIIT